LTRRSGIAEETEYLLCPRLFPSKELIFSHPFSKAKIVKTHDDIDDYDDDDDDDDDNNNNNNNNNNNDVPKSVETSQGGKVTIL
jgi:hypothetical protein